MLPSQFGREEYHGDKHEQRAEQVGEVGHEIGIVVEHHSLEWGMVLRELGKVLVYVKHY